VKNLVWIAVALISGAGFATGAAAESFTYTVTAEPGSNAIRVTARGDGGAMMSAVANRLEVTFTYKSGLVEKAVYQCIDWPTPHETTNVGVMCNGGSGEDKYSVIGTCLFNNKGSEMCWGVIEGIAGKRAGKHGTYTHMGSGATTTGEGAWED